MALQRSCLSLSSLPENKGLNPLQGLVEALLKLSFCPLKAYERELFWGVFEAKLPHQDLSVFDAKLPPQDLPFQVL